MTLDQVLALARKHVGNGAAMDSSARLCLADAVSLKDAGKFEEARARAQASLKYSVGIFHQDYMRSV